MTVQELTQLHNRYVEVSSRFRAAWAFHQFIQSVQKIFLEGEKSPYASTFQDVYTQLKALSQSLNASETERIRVELGAIQKQLQELTGFLLAEDNKVAPHFLRQFFQRVKSYDEKILTQLIKFYLDSVAPDDWFPDRVDKVDYLLTRLGEEAGGANGHRQLKDRRKLMEILNGLWRSVDGDGLAAEDLEQHHLTLDALRRSVESIETLDSLNEQQLIGRYRRLKHSLGPLFFQPALTVAILETNLVLRNSIRRLYQQEERRIITDYQRIFELEREVPIGVDLDRDLNEFRHSVERFEQKLQDDELSLKDLAVIRERVRSLEDRLTHAQGLDGSALELPTEPAALPDRDTSPVSVGDLVTEEQGTVLRDAIRSLLSALEESNPHETPKSVALSREMFRFRLEPREVVAFRRCRSSEPCNLSLERFLLRSAATRAFLAEQAEEIRGLLDESTVAADGPVFSIARQGLAAGGELLAGFSHRLNQGVLSGDLAEAQQLQLLQARLMREYSGLWLLVFRRRLAAAGGLD